MKNIILPILILLLTIISVHPVQAEIHKTSGYTTSYVTIHYPQVELNKPYTITQQTGKRRFTAFVLALIGVLAIPIGLHRFYLGYKKTGIFMLILTLTGIGAIVSWIWTVIDLIKIMDGTLKPADGSEYIDADEDII